MEAIHEEAQALFDAGAIDKERMAEYDNACLASKTKKTSAAVNPNTPVVGIKPLTTVYAHTK